MSEFKFADLAMLFLLFAVPLMFGLFVYAARKRKRAIEMFIGAGLVGRISTTVSPARRRVMAAMVLLAVAMIAFALARPCWNPTQRKIERRGRDVVFLLDVSRSMLAEDLAPNRLERAKLAIRDCLERLQGDRVGIVVFSGTAAVKCPLTLDYGFFRMMLDDISTDSISRGGTLMGDAIRHILKAEIFDDQEKECKDIVLITDGEDHDSFPVDAAEKAGERGIRIIAIGFGNANEGRRIPVTNPQGRKEFLKYKGKEVWSRLDADTLKKMALATPGGTYYHVSTGAIDLGDVYARLILSAEKKALESQTVKLYEEKFQIFLGLAFALLCLEAGIGDRRRKIRDNGVGGAGK
ncbi:MAG: VWA domain-containing protein [bacterium]